MFVDWADIANQLETMWRNHPEGGHLSDRLILPNHLAQLMLKNPTDEAHIDGQMSSQDVDSHLTEHENLGTGLVQSNLNNSINSTTTFREMNIKEPILLGLSGMGFHKPTPIQECALPRLIGVQPQNLIAQLQTRIEKTTMIVVTMLSRIRTNEKHCQCLCMVPTNEDALHVVAIGRGLSRYFYDVTFAVAIDDPQATVDFNEYLTNQVVVGTPDHVMQWVRKKGNVRLDISKVTVFILDEADILIQQEGFLKNLRRMKRRLLPTCQRLLFSIGFDQDLLEFARKVIPEPIEMLIGRDESTLRSIQQYYLISTDQSDQLSAFYKLYAGFRSEQTIIFCATRNEAKWLQERLYTDDNRVILLSGYLGMSDRQTVIRKFHNREYQVLIATDTCTRGIDIPVAKFVVNWSIPLTKRGSADCETYLRRICRSGRTAVNFVMDKEKRLVTELEKHFGISIPPFDNEHIPNM